METLDPVIIRHALTILDGEKTAILVLADRLQALGHPNAPRVRELYEHPYYSAPRDESLAVLLTLPDTMGWSLACDFAEHFIREHNPAGWTDGSDHWKIIKACRARIASEPIDKKLADLLEHAPRYYQMWAKATSGSEAACNALTGILAFSATGGREPAWQHGRIRDALLAAQEAQT